MLLGKRWHDFSPIEAALPIGDRWLRLQTLLDQFWSRFLKEYEHTLAHHRRPNSADSGDLQEGDIVVVLEGKRGQRWPIAKVIRTFPNPQDARIRMVELESKNRSYIRHASVLAKLLPLTEQLPADQ